MFCYHVQWPPLMHYASNMVFFHPNVVIATLALGLQPRYGLARLWAKKEA